MTTMTLPIWVPLTITDVGEAGPCTRLEVWRASVEPGEHLKLDTIVLPPIEERTEIYAAELVRHIERISQAEADAQAAIGAGTVQKFSVLAFRGDSDNAEASFPFIAYGVGPIRNVGDALAASSEPPTERGATAMIQRHAENVLRVHLSSFESVVNIQSRALAQSEQRRDHAEQRALETMLLRQRLLDREHEWDLEMMREKNREQWKAEIVGVIKTLLPQVVAGLPLADRRAVVGAEAVDLARSLSDTELSSLAKLDLTPESRAKLGRLVDLARNLAAQESSGKPSPHEGSR